MDAVANETKLSRSRTIGMTNGGEEGEGACGKKRKQYICTLFVGQAQNRDKGFQSYAYIVHQILSRNRRNLFRLLHLREYQDEFITRREKKKLYI